MKERPIIFNTENIKAILDGRKTQTRRVCKQANEWEQTYEHSWVHFNKRYNWWEFKGRSDFSGLIEPFVLTCPYGQVGDRLWVRETTYKRNDGIWLYKADDEWIPRSMNYYKRDICPSIHMPGWASRITLEITEVRVERLQEISKEDCLKEGILLDPHDGRYACVGIDSEGNITGLGRYIMPSPIPEFGHLWDSLNAKRGYGWEVNPWVWVVTFKKEEN